MVITQQRLSLQVAIMGFRKDFVKDLRISKPLSLVPTHDL